MSEVNWGLILLVPAIVMLVSFWFGRMSEVNWGLILLVLAIVMLVSYYYDLFWFA